MIQRHMLCLIGLVAAAPLPAQQPAMTARDSAVHALNRLAYGATPGQVDRVVKEGVLRWIDRQLAVTSIDDPGLADVLARFDLLGTSPGELLRSFEQVRQARRQSQRAGGSDSMMTPLEPAGARPDEARALRLLGGQLQQLVAVRAVESDHQLAEVMADFWSNHFNIFVGKNLDRVYLPGYIEDVIRPRLFGRFEDLLLATASSPAMMVYLDNAESVAPGSKPPELERLERFRQQGVMRGGLRGRGTLPGRIGGRGAGGSPERIDSLLRMAESRRPTGINENYARELMELHTLGVDGGYTQHDVTEVARILTGWGVERPLRGGGFTFNAWAHDRGAKIVLGREFPSGEGRDEGIRLLRMLAEHASTMHYVSGRLCARFVNDVPPDGCIDDAVLAWKRSNGDIREVMRAIVRSPDFWAPANIAAKIKTPLEFVMSAVRAVGGVPDTTPRLAMAVARLGQPLYQHVAPDGYGERQEDWVNSGALLARMNFAVALAANRVPGVTVDLDALLPPVEDRTALVASVDRLILGGHMSAQTRRVILEQIADLPNPASARTLAIGLAVGGPEFQKQ